VSFRGSRKIIDRWRPLGATGGVIGAFVGYEIRRRLVNSLHIKDFVVAVCEDVVAIFLALFLVSR
jgi:uncharacterized membrane protein